MDYSKVIKNKIFVVLFNISFTKSMDLSKMSMCKIWELFINSLENVSVILLLSIYFGNLQSFDFLHEFNI